MLVDVVCLRHFGTKLDTAALKAAKPARGELSIQKRGRLDQHGQRIYLITANLKPHSGALLIYELVNAVVSQMAGESFLVTGLEVHVKHGPGSSYQCGQTWLCTHVASTT